MRSLDQMKYTNSFFFKTVNSFDGNSKTSPQVSREAEGATKGDEGEGGQRQEEAREEGEEGGDDRDVCGYCCFDNNDDVALLIWWWSWYSPFTC